MEALLNAAVPSRFFQLKLINRKSVNKDNSLCCSRLGDHNNMEMLEESSQSYDKGLDMNHSDIWKLFREAQQNILFLNKQRVMAVEELKKTQQEKQLLSYKLQELEARMQDLAGKGPMTQSDKSSICSELLLRIDSMVLTAMVTPGEASHLRKLVVTNKASICEVFSEIRQKRDAELLADLRNFSGKSRRITHHIVHICTEMAPVAAVGSLASYVTGLSHALQEQGNLVEVILPKYASLNLDEVEGLRNIEAEFDSYFSGRWHGNRLWTGVVSGVGVTFVEPLYYSGFFNRDMIYGYSDDFERFTYFSRAALDYIIKSGKQPDVLHIHNWQTSLVAPLFWDVFVNQGLGSTRILFTCQDFSSQCLEQPDKLALCGLDPSRLHRPDRLQDDIKKRFVNILKGGVVYSNKVVILSSVYSKGRIIHSPSHGLASTLAIHKDKLAIAPYGFDGTIWDPSVDKLLPANYSAEDLKGKAICKAALRQRLGLSGRASMFIVGCICCDLSVVDLENLKAVVWLAYRKGAQFVFMGAGKKPNVNAALESFQNEFKDKDVRFLNYNEVLSHLLLAGSDIILCPSFDDQLEQIPLKAIKYGTAPVALTLSNNGFSWHGVEHDIGSTRASQYLLSTFGNVSLGQALDQINTSQWNQKIKDGMAKDFSWNAECCDIHMNAYTSIKSL